MKKIIYSLVIMIAAGSLFTSCIQQLEPTGIQEMREAKAEYYEALAGLKNADAAYRQAEARYEDACTKLKEAEVKAKELLNAQQELNNAKLKATNEAEIAERKAQCEAALVAWQTTLTNNQIALEQAQYNLQETLRNIAAASIGLNDAEKKVLNSAIRGYERAIEDYNKAVAALYRAQKDLYEAQYDQAAGIGVTDYEEELVGYAESYEDSVVFYEAVEAYYAEKLAEYVFTDDPAVWEAELEEIADSIATWEYNANIIDADMAKKFANEYYDGVKAWNEAYAAYVEANEPEAPKVVAPDGYLFHKDGVPAAYEKELPVHTVGTLPFVLHFNKYLQEWRGADRKAEIVVPENIFGDRNDVFTVSGLTIDNYDLFLNGDPDNKDVIGLNGILETLERDLVLKGDATSVAALKEKMEAAQKKFYSADSVVRGGLFAYKPFADTLALAKEAVANMNQEAKAIADAQTALAKAFSVYAKGLGRSSVLWAGNPISSNADSVALFNAIKNFAQARVDYFGDGSILAKYYDVEEKVAKAEFKFLNSLVYIKADNMYQPKRDSVALQDIEFSGFHQAAVHPSFLNPIEKPISHRDGDGYYWAKGMVFNSLYGGAGLYWSDDPIPFYYGYDVNLGNSYWDAEYIYPGTSGEKSGEFWQYAYEVGQQVPANYYEDDAFIKAICLILKASPWFDASEYSGVETSVQFWAKLASLIQGQTADKLAETGLLGTRTVVNEDKTVSVVYGSGSGLPVISQEVIKLLYAVYNNLEDYCDIYNAYWGGDGSEDGDSHTDLARQNLRAVDKQGNKHAASDFFIPFDEIKWVGLVMALVEGEIVNVVDVENSLNWSVKTFTEPYKIVYYDFESDFPVNLKELRIALQNLGIIPEVEYTTQDYIHTYLFNGTADATLLAKMFYAEQVYDMYANAKDAIEIVKQLKGVDAEVKAAAAEVTKAYEAYYTALSGYGQDYVTFYKTLTGDVVEPKADKVIDNNTNKATGIVDWAEVVYQLKGRVYGVMDEEDYILDQIEADQWTVKGEMKAMAEKFLPTYPADFHAAMQLKGHSAEMINLYEGLYNALDETYLTAVLMKDGDMLGQVKTITVGHGRRQHTKTIVVYPETFQEAYNAMIGICSGNIAYCENKIAFFEKMIALVEAGFGPVDANIAALEAEVEYYTQKLVDAQVRLDVAKAKYDEAIAAYAE